MVPSPVQTPALHVFPGPQSMHLAPLSAQKVGVGGAWQPPAMSQHPLAHDVASQTQLPATHRVPAAHAGLEPQLQAPARQLSASETSQLWHALPFTPQRASVAGVVQAPLKQHPVGQEVASHTQVPPAHRCPAAQAAVPPQRHTPPEQLSAFCASHAAHWFPPLPHLARVGGFAQDPPVQQPAHEALSQTQPPATQRWPALHAAFVPHLQPPAAQLSPAWPQATQAAPPVPQPAAVGVVQTFPAQQPRGQEAASQPHRPPLHAWPAEHAAPAPQRQVPSDAHESASAGLQTRHAEPWLPQVARPFVLHVWVASQQPVAQLPALQLPPVHTPPVHVCAAPHAGPVPHRQAPWVEHPSELAHAAHACPAGAHAPTANGVQVLPAQQPRGHDVASQTQAPATQRWPSPHAGPEPQAQTPAPEHPSAFAGLHARHAAPLAPQVAAVFVVHTPLAQQPFGHEAAVQPQPPAPHACPGAHSGSAPQRQSPLAEQAFARVGSHAAQAAPALAQAAPVVGATHASPLQQPVGHEVASHLHWFKTQRCPAPQAPLPAPHWQTPCAEQRSARAGSHAAQAAPAAPHVLIDRLVQVAPAQQPLAHEPALQSQTPLLQNWPTSQAGTQGAPASPDPPLPPDPPPRPPPPPPGPPPPSFAAPPSAPQRPLATHSSYSALKSQALPSSNAPRKRRALRWLRGAPGEQPRSRHPNGARWKRPAPTSRRAAASACP